IGMGARQTAMANAFTAVSDDVYSIYYNPAGLGKINTGNNFSAMYAQLWPSIGGEGLNDMFIGMNFLTKSEIGIGVSWQSRRLESVVSADTISFGGGKRIKENILAGITFKYLKFELITAEIDTIPELKNKRSKSALGIDIGLLFQLRKIDIGFAVKNVNSPDIGLFEAAPVAMVVKAGVSKKISDKVLVVLDLSNTSSITEFSLGSEVILRNNIILRGGILSSTANYSKTCLGVGLRINKIQLDYGYVIQLLGGTGNDTGTHRVSFNIRLK
ncbi:MAG: type IX secretion system membrane protein PorP/SprF, partial [Endomicrobia bacterium]|nr:type IX secretion system membrane protein PorP/SprF [Endomicrobiia bacterium]